MSRISIRMADTVLAIIKKNFHWSFASELLSVALIAWDDTYNAMSSSFCTSLRVCYSFFFFSLHLLRSMASIKSKISVHFPLLMENPISRTATRSKCSARTVLSLSKWKRCENWFTKSFKQSSNGTLTLHKCYETSMLTLPLYKWSRWKNTSQFIICADREREGERENGSFETTDL